jgi:hypothetical protein
MTSPAKKQNKLALRGEERERNKKFFNVAGKPCISWAIDHDECYYRSVKKSIVDRFIKKTICVLFLVVSKKTWNYQMNV